LFLERLFSFLGCLLLPDVVEQHSSVSEKVPFRLRIQLPVEVRIDLGFAPEVSESLAEDANSADPLPFGARSGVLCPAPFPEAMVPA
jgi:hypothetical protein